MYLNALFMMENQDARTVRFSYNLNNQDMKKIAHGLITVAKFAFWVGAAFFCGGMATDEFQNIFKKKETEE